MIAYTSIWRLWTNLSFGRLNGAIMSRFIDDNDMLLFPVWDRREIIRSVRMQAQAPMVLTFNFFIVWQIHFYWWKSNSCRENTIKPFPWYSLCSSCFTANVMWCVFTGEFHTGHAASLHILTSWDDEMGQRYTRGSQTSGEPLCRRSGQDLGSWGSQTFSGQVSRKVLIDWINVFKLWWSCTLAR